MINGEIPPDQPKSGGRNQGSWVGQLGDCAQRAAFQNHIGDAGIQISLASYHTGHRPPGIHDSDRNVDADLKPIHVPKINQSICRIAGIWIGIIHPHTVIVAGL